MKCLVYVSSLLFINLCYFITTNAKNVDDQLVVKFISQKSVKDLKFSWKSCGSPSYPSHIDDVSLSPDPLKLPGNVTIGFQGGVNVNLKAPLKMVVEVKKKIVFWIKVPCINHFGSCTYDDICQLIPLLKCPPIFQKYGIPCQCPITAGNYKLPPSQFYIDDSFLPPFISDGSYQATATVSDSSQNIVCIHLEFSIV